MGKRKRAADDQGLTFSGRTKRAKGQEQLQEEVDTEVAEKLHVEADSQDNPPVARVPKSEDDSARAIKLQKRERRRLKKEHRAALQTQEHLNGETDENQFVGHNSVKTQRPKKRRRKDDRNPEEHNGDSPLWKVSSPVGGRLLDVDPLFSLDEGHLLLAYELAIAVYSSATSSLVRHLRISKSNKISAFALCSLRETDLYISTVKGTIEKWDWEQGCRVGYWKLSSSIYALTTSSRISGDALSDLVYTVDRKGADPWLVTAHRLVHGGESPSSEVKTLFSNQEAISSLKVLENGRFIVATSAAQLIIGHSNSPSPAKLQGLTYTWRIVESPEWIVSIDVRISHPEWDRKPSKGGKKRIESLDIALGGLKGSIHIYENLLGNLICREQPHSKDNTKDIKSRRLHWHRNAVLALKWSLDGNYLISGGEETVLVLWQLETGRREDLPHLGAPIESIVVSPSGSAYSLRLADNSAMVLSTSELRPTFSVAGIQIPSSNNGKSIDVPFLPTVDAPFPGLRPALRRNITACTSASHPGCLLLAVPPSSPSKSFSTTPQNTSYLQTFDIGAAHQISRQALTRTKVTALNMGPESNSIEEPSVTHMQPSVDGQWLATVDEWMPPKSDLAPLAFDTERMIEEQISRLEIYLKFWAWSDASKAWELVSRIDGPHTSRSGNAYRGGDVLGLASDPSCVGFATLGADGAVKTWRPAIRRRHGLDVRDKDGRNLTSWHCEHVIPLECPELTAKTSYQGAKLAYSPDGSILVGALQLTVASPIYVLDTYNGELLSIQIGLYDGPLLGLGIVNKYMMVLSDELCVFDLVNDELCYGIQLQSHGLSLEEQTVLSHLAVDIEQGLFAVALPEPRRSASGLTKLQSQFAVFDPTDASPLFQTAVPEAVATLVSAAGRKGFIAIDSAAEVRTLMPARSPQALSSTSHKNGSMSSGGLKDLFGSDGNARALSDLAREQAGLFEPKLDVANEARYPRDDTAVVSQERLAEVFDVGPAYALPPITDLFEQVASLCNGQVAS